MAGEEIGLEVNNDKSKHNIMPPDQNSGRSHSIQTKNTSFQMMDEFKYLGKMLTNQNIFHEVMKIRLKSGNACYHLVQNIVFRFVFQIYNDKDFKNKFGL